MSIYEYKFFFLFLTKRHLYLLLYYILHFFLLNCKISCYRSDEDDTHVFWYVYESSYWQFRERCWLYFLVLRKTKTWHSSCKLHCRHICSFLFINCKTTVSLNDIKKYLRFIFLPNIINLSPKFNKLSLSNWKVNEIVRMACIFPLTRLKLSLYHSSKNMLASIYYWYKTKEIKLELKPLKAYFPVQ